ncbi:MAG TPA: sigma-70 family RNA polymerase sigma factor [Thermoanaerobaculia bacterium]|nr:sigma-70 family RNA polymerase sigma factor [Thermoanaerobaculia bacterium]
MKVFRADCHLFAGDSDFFDVEGVLSNPGENGAEELVRRILRGDPQAEEELIERHRRGVAAALWSAGPDASVADDLYQETFRIALEKIRRGQLRDPSRLSGFLASLARNLVIEHFRRTAWLRVSSVPDEEPADPEPNPLDDLLRLERAEMVRRVLLEMTSERDRELLSRFYIEGEEKDAICRDLGLTGLHFNRVLFRARERYRELYLAAAGEGR